MLGAEHQGRTKSLRAHSTREHSLNTSPEPPSLEVPYLLSSLHRAAERGE